MSGRIILYCIATSLLVSCALPERSEREPNEPVPTSKGVEGEPCDANGACEELDEVSDESGSGASAVDSEVESEDVEVALTHVEVFVQRKRPDHRRFRNRFSVKVHRGRLSVSDRLACGRFVSASYAAISAGDVIEQRLEDRCLDCYALRVDLCPTEKDSSSD